MKLVSKTILALALATSLTACGTGNDGYYDSRGNWHWSGAKDPQYSGYDQKADPAINPSGDDNYYVDHSAVRGDSAKVAGYRADRDPEVAPYYHRRGYYNQYGEYVPYGASTPHIARSYFPPRGQCRIWFTDGRAPVDQPPVESCVGIQDRVPDSAYVVYGG